MGAHTFNPTTDIPTLSGKVILVTGSTSGIGKQTAIDLSKHSPSQVWITARNKESGDATLKELQTSAPPGTSIKLLELDLTSFTSIKRAATEFQSDSDGLDILILNAGIMGGEPGLTDDGYEKQFGTNHMGHALLLKLLTPQLIQASKRTVGIEPRVVMLSSAGHKSSQIPPGGIDLSSVKSAQLQYSGIMKYCQSKLANAVYAAPLAKRFPQFTTVSINPGEVKTGLFSKGGRSGGWIVTLLAWVVAPLVGSPVEEGAKNSLWAATAKNVESGRFYDPVGKSGGESPVVKEGKLGEMLWKWTERELENHGI